MKAIRRKKEKEGKLRERKRREEKDSEMSRSSDG